MTDLIIVDYNEKSFVLTGEGTKKIKNRLMELKGSYNRFLTHPKTKAKFSGWVFSKKRMNSIKSALNLI